MAYTADHNNSRAYDNPNDAVIYSYFEKLGHKAGSLSKDCQPALERKQYEIHRPGRLYPIVIGRGNRFDKQTWMLAEQAYAAGIARRRREMLESALEQDIAEPTVPSRSVPSPAELDSYLVKVNVRCNDETGFESMPDLLYRFPTGSNYAGIEKSIKQDLDCRYAAKPEYEFSVTKLAAPVEYEDQF
jgi:hypothetical protein